MRFSDRNTGGQLVDHCAGGRALLQGEAGRAHQGFEANQDPEATLKTSDPTVRCQERRDPVPQEPFAL